MSDRIPNEVEVRGYFSQHLGPRYQAAGVSLQFHSNQGSGIVCKASSSQPSYVRAIIKGIEDGLIARYGSAPIPRAIWITKIEEHPVDSSDVAFYLAARGAIDLAHSVSNTTANFE